MAVDYLINDGFKAAICFRALNLTSSTYYNARNRPLSKTMLRHLELTEKIIEIHEESKQTYGSPRVHRALKRADIECSKTTVQKIMRENKLKARKKKAYKLVTTLSNHQEPIAKRIFDNDKVKANKPSEIWGADITFIPTEKKWIYLNVILDICTRKIVGWSLAEHMRSELVDEALNKALKQGKCKVHHTDQGA